MIAGKRKVLLSLVAIAALSISVSAALSQEPEPSYSPDGAWFATAAIGSRTLPFMDVYMSNPTTPGRAGSVVCTLSGASFDTPLGKLNATSGGHGNWSRVAKNRFAFTVFRIMIDADAGNQVPDGTAVGTIKFWGTITITGPDTFVGTMNAQYYGPNGEPWMRVEGLTTSATRIAIETN